MTVEDEETLEEGAKTDLQSNIIEIIKQYPDLDDKEIQKKVREKRHPGEPWENRDPSYAYVGRMRNRLKIEGQPPTFKVEPAEKITEIPEEALEEEKILPFEEGFKQPEEPEEIIEPEITPTVESFTLDDTQFILVFTFDKFADWSGWQGWRFKTDAQGHLTDPSEKRFAQLTKGMADKYLPDLLKQYFLEVMFCYTGLMIVGSRTKEYLGWRKKQKPLIEPKKEEQKEPENQPDTKPEDKTTPEQGEDDFKRRWGGMAIR